MKTSALHLSYMKIDERNCFMEFFSILYKSILFFIGWNNFMEFDKNIEVYVKSK